MFPPASGMSTSVLGVPPSMATGMIPDQYATPRRLSNIRNQSASNLLQTDRQMPPAMPQYGNMPYYSPHFYGMPSYMPQLSSNAKLIPEMTAKQATPDTFIKVIDTHCRQQILKRPQWSCGLLFIRVYKFSWKD